MAWYPVRRRRHDHLFHLGRRPGDPEHPGHRMPVDVGVRDPDLRPGRGQRRGQVHRHRRFADPALAAGHREDPGQRGGLGEGDSSGASWPPRSWVRSARRPLVVSSRRVRSRTRGHALDRADRGGRLAGDRVRQRAAGDREGRHRRGTEPSGETSMFVTMPSSVIGRRISGSFTPASARDTWLGGGGGHGGGCHVLMRRRSRRGQSSTRPPGSVAAPLRRTSGRCEAAAHTFPDVSRRALVRDRDGRVQAPSFRAG